MKHWAAMMLLAIAGTGLALEPSPVPQPQRQVLAQFSVGAGTTLVGFKIARRTAPANEEPAGGPGRFCLKLPFNCAFVIEQADADGSGVVVRPQFGPIAFEVVVGRAAATGL
jgi:hypothetical protein